MPRENQDFGKRIIKQKENAATEVLVELSVKI